MIDFTRYKRFFAFGCSYTCYLWPTWADIISKEMPNAEYINFGKPGAGNLLISARIAEANNRFNFTETDLVMVMFSSYSREDRWVEEALGINGWLAKGNVYLNGVYSKDWIRTFASERGYLIRDAALLDLSVHYLESLPCKSVFMKTTPIVLNSEPMQSDAVEPFDITSIYKDTLDKIKPSIYELELKGWDVDYKGFQDGHPSPIIYARYLEKIGVNLSPSTKQYAFHSTEKLKNITDRSLVQNEFKDLMYHETKCQKMVF